MSSRADRFVPGGSRGGGRVRQVGGSLQPHEAGHPQGEGEGETGILSARIVFTRTSNKTKGRKDFMEKAFTFKNLLRVLIRHYAKREPKYSK